MVSPKPEDRRQPDKSDKLDLAYVAPDSFRRKGDIERWRFWLPLVLVPIFALWRVGDAWLEDMPERSWHSPGHLATAHVLYDNQCSACHADFSPVSAGNWLATGLGRTHAADAQCSECHESSNHHAAEKADRKPACTSCHLEHRGRTASLVRCLMAVHELSRRSGQESGRAHDHEPLERLAFR